MKFGGDCLSTPKNQEKAKEIINSFEGKKIVICSAMGRDGFPYSTSNLNKICLDDYISNKERDRLLANGEIISSIASSITRFATSKVNDNRTYTITQPVTVKTNGL